MKLKYLAIPLMLAAIPLLNSCGDDDDNSNPYAEWADANAEWLSECENKLNPDGTAYYRRLRAPWDATTYVLIHYFGTPNTEPLRPLYTSTVDVAYKVYTCDNVCFDSSDNIIAPTPGALRVTLSSDGIITGWPIALTDMHVGDSCEVIIPYQMAYGVTGFQSVKPYSNLRFNMRLVDIPYYEVKP